MKVTVNVPTSPEGSIFEFPLLGAFKNGFSEEVDPNRAEQWREAMGLEEIPPELVFGDVEAVLPPPVVEDQEEDPGTDQGETDEEKS